MLDARNSDASVFSIRGDGKTSIQSEVDASSVGTGALYVVGGASVGKNLWVGDGVYVTFESDVSSKVREGKEQEREYLSYHSCSLHRTSSPFNTLTSPKKN